MSDPTPGSPVQPAGTPTDAAAAAQPDALAPAAATGEPDAGRADGDGADTPAAGGPAPDRPGGEASTGSVDVPEPPARRLPGWAAPPPAAGLAGGVAVVAAAFLGLASWGSPVAFALAVVLLVGVLALLGYWAVWR